MKAEKFVVNVPVDGLVELNLAQYASQQVVIAVSPACQAESHENGLLKAQERSGFAQNVLASRDEDVWNDL
ncbi:hypothetical protein [Methylomarinum vadi]|uniref:hypothetical protein n=1 Tax=Methylomarinum vadi TaxID=438855 RepID=UPI0004DEF62E|nr:hypothetical protein [Methylomarinum vadi]